VSAKRRLVPLSEVEQHIEQLRRLGIQIGAVDIRSDGVTFFPPNQEPENALAQWKNKNRDRLAPR